MLTVGFIGNGKSANRYHIPFILQRSDKIKIKMIYTRKHSRDVWDEIPGVIYTEDLQELLNDQEVQVIIISTPSQSHYEPVSYTHLDVYKRQILFSIYINRSKNIAKMLIVMKINILLFNSMLDVYCLPKMAIHI